MTIHQSAIAKHILNILNNATQRMTPLDLARRVSHDVSISIRQGNHLIRRLVDVGQLEWVYDLGCTFIEPAFNKPIRVSPRIVLVPPGAAYRPAGGKIGVVIEPGASFGTGRHPTSRLALHGIDTWCRHTRLQPKGLPDAVLDVGTGSGILVLAAIRLGCRWGLGIDLDPVARFEARHNVASNRLAGHIQISSQRLENIDRQFDLVIANLRMPSLIKSADAFRRRLVAGGGLVVSGIRVDEKAGVLTTFARTGFEVFWEADQNGWQALVFQHMPPKPGQKTEKPAP